MEYETILEVLGVGCINDLTEEFCKSVKELILCNLSLKDINGCANIFHKLNNLETLDISDNCISNIEKNAFKHFPNLKAFIFINNFKIFDNSDRLKELDKDIFRYNRKLEKIILNNSGFDIIHQDTFKYNINLRIVDLSYNFLEVLHKDTFKYNKNLEEVYLDFNDFKSLDLGINPKLYRRDSYEKKNDE